MNPSKILLLVCLVASCSAYGAGDAAAQMVRGSVVVIGTEQPVQGALVFLEGEGGERLQGSLTNEWGAFVIRAAAPGRYTLRAQRIGFADGASATFDLAPGATTMQRIGLRERAIELGEIVVQARRRCTVRPTSDLTVAQLWDDARKALEATAFTEAERVYGFSIRRYRRLLDAATMRVLDDTSTVSSSSGSASPYTARPVATLLSQGFIYETDEGVRYDAPDANVLLSDAFSGDYCLRVAVQEPDVDGVVGIAFEPVDRSGPPAIRGTLWLDRRSYELRWLDFRYVRADLPFAEDSRIGGRVEFEAMPDGTWIVRRWHLRVPASARTRLSSGIQQPLRATVLSQIVEEGGEVLDTRMESGIRRLAELATVVGMVRDSARGGPFSGARVFLSGTSYSAMADSAGRFVMDEVPEGAYEIGFMHPELQSMNVHPAPVPLTVRPGEETWVELGLAARARAESLSRMCAADADHKQENTGILVGRVTNRVTGEAVGRAAVEVIWRDVNWLQYSGSSGLASGLILGEETVQTETDVAGRFVFCALPRNRRLYLHAVRDERQSMIMIVEPLQREEFAERLVTLP